MSRNEFEFAYRQSSIAGASPIGLVIALYDRVSRDFRSAAAAIRAGDIEKRCSALDHASVLIGHLESWIDHTNGGELATNLATFYTYLRSKMMEASIKLSATLLEEQVQLISQVRSAWQQKDSMEVPLASVPVPNMAYGLTSEHTAFSRSA